MASSGWSVPDAAMDTELHPNWTSSLADDEKEMIINAYTGNEAACNALVGFLTTTMADDLDDGASVKDKIEALVAESLSNFLRSKLSLRQLNSEFVNSDSGVRQIIDEMISSEVLRATWRSILIEHAEQITTSPALSYAKRTLDLNSDPQILPSITRLLSSPGLLLENVTGFLEDKSALNALVETAPYAGHDPHSPFLPQVLYSVIMAGDEQAFFVSQRMLYNAAVAYSPDSSPAQLLGNLAQAMRTLAAREHGMEWAVRSAILVEAAVKTSVTVPSARITNPLVKLVASGAEEMSPESVGNLVVAASQISKELLGVSEVMQGLVRASFEPKRLDPHDNLLREPVATMLARGATIDSSTNHGSLEREILEFGFLLEKLEPGCARFQVMENYNRICDYIQEPILALGSLYWVRDGLVKNPKPSELCRAPGIQVVTDGYLDMLEKIAMTHPQHFGDVVGVLWAAFLHEYPSLSSTQGTRLKVEYLEWIIRVSRYGSAVDVIKRFETVAPAADRSIIRTFIEGILGLVGPPYSKAFKECMYRFCALEQVETTLVQDNAEDCRKLIRRFCKECKEEFPKRLRKVCRYDSIAEPDAQPASM